MSTILYGCGDPSDFRRLQGVQDLGAFRRQGLTEADMRRLVEAVLERLRDDKCEYCGGNADTCRCDGCRMCIGCKDPHWDLDD
jgi:hypothetical protein